MVTAVGIILLFLPQRRRQSLMHPLGAEHHWILAARRAQDITRIMLQNRCAGPACVNANDTKL